MPDANPNSRHIYQTDFGTLILPPSVVTRTLAMKWRKGKPWCPDMRFKGGREWLAYEKRVRAWAQAEFEAGRSPTYAPGWET